MPPSPLDDRIVVALPRPIRPQELRLCLDSTTTTTTTTTTRYLDATVAAATATTLTTTTTSGDGHGSLTHSTTTTVISTTVVKIRTTNLTYMPSSSGSTRSLTCGCSSASCCTVTTYDKDSSRPHPHPHPHPHPPPHPSQHVSSASSPNLTATALDYGDGPGTSGTLPGSSYPSASLGGRGEVLSAPSLTSGPSGVAGGGAVARTPFRVMHPNELATKLARCPLGHPVAGPVPVVIDCRPFLEYNKSHVQGAVHINCSDKISRRRLQQGKITVLDLLSTCHQAKDSYKGIFSKEIVVYDESTIDPGCLSAAQPLHVVLESLRREGKDPIVLRGGLSAFRQLHEDLCDHSLHLYPEGLEEEGLGGAGAGVGLAVGPGLSGALPHSLPSTPDIENAEVTPILPYLFLGNEHDAQDLDLMSRLNIGFVLNVTTHLPLYHYHLGLLSYKRLPASDSSKQNLRQYFEEAFEFIEEAQQAGQGVLIHCQAGVSRSATVVIAYLMKHSWMTMTDAYKFVKSRRPIISPNLNFMGQLLEFEEDLNSGVTPRILTPKLVGVETAV